MKFIIVTLIVGIVCFVVAGKVSNKVQTTIDNKTKRVESNIQSYVDYIHSELGE